MSTFFALFLTVLAWGAPTQPVTSVTAKTIQLHEISDEIVLPGKIVPQTNAVLLAETEGVVGEIMTPIGTTVKKGQRLLKILNTDPVYNYAPAMIVAPFGGVVSQIEVSVGSRVQKGQKLGAITDPGNVKITAEITASELPHVNSKVVATFQVNRYDKPSEVVLIGVSPMVDAMTGTASAEFKFKEKNTMLPGLLGKLSVRIGSHQGIEIPEQSITYRGQDPHLRIIQNNKVAYKPVKLGPTRKGLIEILDGLKADDQIVVRTSRHLAEGEEVKVE